MSYQRTHRTSRRRRTAAPANGNSMVAFLLVACFGILFAGCSEQTAAPETADEFTFTEEDVARFREIVMGEEEVGTGSVATPRLVGGAPSSVDAETIVLDVSQKATYGAIRATSSNSTENSYRVTNAFVNMRSAPNVTASQVEQLEQGTAMTVLEFPDAAWAKVQLPNDREGFVSSRYIAKVTSEEKLAEEKKAFEGQYFVNFGFLNVRAKPDADSEKLGELPGQSIVRPLSKDDVWARVQFNGKEGYIAVQYLQPFLPNFLVRQENYTVPVLHYDMQRDGMEDVLVQHIAALQDANANLLTFQGFADVLLQQQERDARVNPRSVIVAISGITNENIKDISDVLRASNARATLFMQTNQIGIGGITEQTLLTMVANGYDIQSATHTGDDLRSLTNSQIALELKQSRKLLEEKTGRTVHTILYPLGGVNSRVQDIAQEAGYLFGVSNDAKRTYNRDEFLQVPSFTILDTMTKEDIVTIVLGAPENASE